MNANGADHYAQLEHRLAELEAAVGILTRELGETWRPRLLACERDLELVARELATRREANDR